MKFNDAMRKARDRAGLSWDELSIWFAKPKSTVWSWANVPDREPAWYDQERIMKLVDALVKDKAFPIPLSVRQADRGQYVKQHRERYATR